MDGKTPPPSRGTPFAQPSQDDIDASNRQAAYTSISNMVYEFDQAWDDERTIADYRRFMHAALLHELDRRLAIDANNQQHVDHIARQRRMIINGEYQLPGGEQNFPQIAVTQPALAIPVFGSVVMGSDRQTITDWERGILETQDDSAASSPEPTTSLPDPTATHSNAAASLPAPTDPYFHAMMEGNRSDRDAAIRQAQDEEESSNMIENALAFFEEKVAEARSDLARFSTPDLEEGLGQKRPKIPTSTSPKQVSKKQKTTRMQSKKPANVGAEEQVKAKKPGHQKFVGEDREKAGYDNMGEMDDLTQQFKCPIRGCETAISTRRDFYQHMRLSPEDKTAKNEKGHGIASGSFRDHRGILRKKGFVLVVYNKKKSLWIGKDHLYRNRWYIGGFKKFEDGKVYKGGKKEKPSVSKRNSSHVTLQVAEGSNCSGLRAEANLTLNAINSCQGLQGGDEQPGETNTTAQDDGGAEDAEPSLYSVDAASGDDRDRRRNQPRKADHQTSLRVYSGGHVRIVPRTPPAGAAIIPEPLPGPQGQQLQRLVESVQRKLRAVGYFAHHPRVVDALSVNDWNIDAAADSYIAEAMVRRANPRPPPAVASHEQRGEHSQDQAASNRPRRGTVGRQH